MGKIVISIVTYNHADIVIETLQSIYRYCDANLIAEVLVIDNGSTDNTVALVRDKFPTVTLLENDNVGYGAAHNIAIRKHLQSADYHLVLNPDIFFKEDVLSKLYIFMEKNKEVGQVMPKILYPDGEIQYLCKLLPTPWQFLLRRFIPIKKLIDAINYKFEMRFSGYNKTMEVPFLSGCFMFFRNAALSEVGLFDEKIFMFCEDIDITRRVYRKYKTVFYPEVIVYHDHQKKEFDNLSTLFLYVKSAIYYFNKWGWFFDNESAQINKEIIKKLGGVSKQG